MYHRTEDRALYRVVYQPLADELTTPDGQQVTRSSNLSVRPHKRVSLLSTLILLALCSANAANATVVTGPITNPANGNVYYLLDKASWEDSEAQAATLGGNLVTINDADENQWVFDTFASTALDQARNVNNADKVWLHIGLSDSGSEGTWTWSSGESSTYTNWASWEPQNSRSDEDYGAMFVNFGAPGMWGDLLRNINLAGDDPYGVVEVVPTLENYAAVDPRATYLRAAGERAPGPSEATEINLATFLPGVPIEPGDWLLLQRKGDFLATQADCDNTPACDDFPVEEDYPRLGTLRNMTAVFSGSDVLLSDPEALRGQKNTPILPNDPNYSRVRHAISVIEGNSVTIPTAADPFDGMTQFQPSDIPEDFVVDIEGSLVNPQPVLVKVPEGATHLFVQAFDGQWFDNTLTSSSEGDRPFDDGGPTGEFGIQIAKVSEGRFIGDADGDGFTTAQDYLIWQQQLGQTGLTSSADFDFNAIVDHRDLAIWEANFRGPNTPEPGTLVLAILAAAGGLAGRSQNSRKLVKS